MKKIIGLLGFLLFVCLVLGVLTPLTDSANSSGDSASFFGGDSFFSENKSFGRSSTFLFSPRSSVSHTSPRGSSGGFLFGVVAVFVVALIAFVAYWLWPGQNKQTLGVDVFGTIHKAEQPRMTRWEARRRGAKRWKPNAPAPGRWNTPGHDVVPVWRTFLLGVGFTVTVVAVIVVVVAMSK